MNQEPLRETGARNPYHILLCQCPSGKPRQKTAMNIWRRIHTQEIEAEVKHRALENGISHKGLAALREKVAKDLFAAVDPVEKNEWKERAVEEHARDLSRWKTSMSDKPSTDPADRQRCIQALTKFMQPILDRISASTGWTATFIAGGPEPAQGGRLNVLSVHSATTAGLAQMTSGRPERAGDKDLILDAYEVFVRNYQSMALPDEDSVENLSSLTETVEMHNAFLNVLRSEGFGAAGDAEVGPVRPAVGAPDGIDGPGHPRSAISLPSRLSIPHPSRSPLNRRTRSLLRQPSCLGPQQRLAQRADNDSGNNPDGHPTVGELVDGPTSRPNFTIHSSNVSPSSLPLNLGDSILTSPPAPPHQSPRKRLRADSVTTERPNKRTRKFQATDSCDNQNELPTTASASDASPWFINGLYYSLKSQIWTMLGPSS